MAEEVLLFTMNDDSVESKSGKAFAELYDLEEELGKGMFSVVHVGKHKETGDNYAIKVITKADMEEFDKRCLKQEIDVLSDLRHDHIIRLYDVFDEEVYIRLVLEKVDGGELLDRLIQKSQYTELEARDVCRTVMGAMQHCHNHKIAHRDIKPENLLLTSPTDDASLKIADFGFAKRCPHDESLKTQCGSAQHVAPEILRNRPYGTKVDMWALGVVHFTLIGGYPPFYTPSNQETFKRILKADVEFPDQYWGHVSDDCIVMIGHLLTMDPYERWSTEQVLGCKWMQEDDEELSQSSLHVNQEKLRDFHAKQKMKAAVLAVIGLNRLQYDGDDLPAIDEEEEQQQLEEEQQPPPQQEEQQQPPPTPEPEEEKQPQEEEEPPRPEEPKQQPEPPVVVDTKKEEPPRLVAVVEPKDEDSNSVVLTRDLYSAYNIAECKEEPINRDYFALAQKSGEFFQDALQTAHGTNFVSVDAKLRKSLYNSGQPNDEYNVYVEWDITAKFAPGYSRVPTRRELCKTLVQTNLEKYILDYVRTLEDNAFGQVTNVFIGHFEC